MPDPNQRPHDPISLDPKDYQTDPTPPDHRSGYVALIGTPNVGKSTLMNALIGKKLSIVSARPSTTRHRVLGILSDEAYQIIFLDTPGIIKPQYRLHDMMMQVVQQAISEADLLLFMVDASEQRIAGKALERIADRPALLVLNKMDLIRQEEALPLVESYVKERAFDDVIPISAAKGHNLDLLLANITQRLPLGPRFYPDDIISEQPERFFIAEIIREKIFQLFRQEIPYSTQVNIVVFEEREGQKDFIDAEIVVERETQKGILIGKGGQSLKQIGSLARADIEQFLERRVYLQLHVKARADWRNREGFLRSFGY
jgi:GTPase